MSKSNKEIVASLESTGDFSPNQLIAIRAEMGPEFIEGAMYVRIGGKIDRVIGDVYIATSKLEGDFNMLNLTASNTSRTRTKFKSESFELVSESIEVDDLV